MATTSNAKKAGRGRKITILEREGVRGVETLFHTFKVADAILAGATTKVIEGRRFVPQNGPNKVILSNLAKSDKENLVASWPKKGRKSIEQVHFVPGELCSLFGPMLVDTATVIKARCDKEPIFFDGIEKYYADKDDRELVLGHESVLEIGSAGIAYNDEHDVDAKAGGLNIGIDDIRGEWVENVFTFWRKKFAEKSNFAFVNPKGQLSMYCDYGPEFDFSAVSKGISIDNPNNVLRVSKWISDGDNIINVLMVFYSLKKNELVEKEISIGEVKTETEVVDVPFVDVQVNVYQDSLDTARDDILKWLNEEIKTERNRLKKLTNNTAEKTIISQINLFDEEKVIEQRKSSILTSDKLKRLELVKKLFLEVPNYCLIRRGFGVPYRDMYGYERGNDGSWLCDERGRNIEKPSKVTNLEKKVEQISTDAFCVTYVDTNGKVWYRNGKRVS